MTARRRWWLLLGFGATLSLVGGRGLQILWMAASLAFIGLVVYGVVRGRRRSYRKFVEEPNKVLATLKHDTTHRYEMDAWL